MEINPEEINPDQIIFITYQLRQMEIRRNDEKNTNRKQALNMEAKALRNRLDELLSVYVEQKKAEASPAPTPDLGNEDYGPKKIVDELHLLARATAEEAEVLAYVEQKPVSIAGEHKGLTYVMHFQKYQY